MLVKGTITVANTAAQGEPNNGVNKKVILQDCAPFTKYLSRINNTQADDASYTDVVIPIYDLIEYLRIIQKHLEFYGNIVEMNRVVMIMAQLLILPKIMLLLIHLKLKKK